MSTCLTPMPHADFLSALQEAGLSCADLAAIADEPVNAVTRMMMGLDRVPYRMSLLVTLLTVPAARELALLHAEIYQPEEPYTEPKWSPSFRESAATSADFVEMETVVFDPPLRIGPREPS